MTIVQTHEAQSNLNHWIHETATHASPNYDYRKRGKRSPYFRRGLESD